MQLPNTPDGEFAPHEANWLPDDTIPATLEPLLALLFRDWGPQLNADMTSYQNWLDTHPEVQSGEMINFKDAKVVHPTLGMVSYLWRGVKVQRASAVHGLWLFQTAQLAMQAMSMDSRQRLEALVSRTNGQQMMNLKFPREMKRQNNVLVLT